MKGIMVHLEITVLAGSLLLSLPHSLAAQGTLVFNGGFNTDANGWVASNIGLNGGYFNAKGNPGGFFLLNNTPAPSTCPTISQSISGLVIGGVYLVSLDVVYSGTHVGPLPVKPSFGVAVDGIFLLEYTTQGQSEWQTLEVFYTALNPSVVLSLAARINDTDVAYGVDNIAMYAIPEPSFLALLSCASLVILAWRKRTRRREPLIKT